MTDYKLFGINELKDLEGNVIYYAEKMFGNSDVYMNPVHITEKGTIKTEVNEN